MIFVSADTIRQLSDATQACSRSTTNVYNFNNNDRSCAQYSTNGRDYYYVTHGHRISRWISRCRTSTQGCQIGFLTPNLANLALFTGSWRQKK